MKLRKEREIAKAQRRRTRRKKERREERQKKAKSKLEFDKATHESKESYLFKYQEDDEAEQFKYQEDDEAEQLERAISPDMARIPAAHRTTPRIAIKERGVRVCRAKTMAIDVSVEISFLCIVVDASFPSQMSYMSVCEQPEKLALCGLGPPGLHSSDRLQDNNKSHLVNVSKAFDAF
ncbi:hypothetical protein HAX54_011323 [Datura stramonium]|uniref:Uncharacterized protein n=1 Tax=Datura stramonium TaxID=4076 RepID=A0ABS8TJA8_DATST|nr:hypothetical protein [Datura stramonium]